MLFRQRFLDGIADGSITLAFRRWRRPTVKAGGRLRTAVGVLAIHAVDVVAEADITTEQAARAGYASRDELIASLDEPPPRFAARSATRAPGRAGPAAQGRGAAKAVDPDDTAADDGEERREGREWRVYRVTFRFDGADPRIALRESATLSDAEKASLERRLSRLDAASPRGPWTTAVLETIEKQPAVRAAALAAAMERETLSFKTDVRKLKELGLTESLEIGYRLSPRGRAWLASRR